MMMVMRDWQQASNGGPPSEPSGGSDRGMPSQARLLSLFQFPNVPRRFPVMQIRSEHKTRTCSLESADGATHARILAGLDQQLTQELKARPGGLQTGVERTRILCLGPFTAQSECVAVGVHVHFFKRFRASHTHAHTHGLQQW